MMQEHPDNEAVHRPKIDLSAALGEAGHEVQELGYEDIPDIGPTLDEHDDNDELAWEHLEAALAQFRSTDRRSRTGAG